MFPDAKTTCALASAFRSYAGGWILCWAFIQSFRCGHVSSLLLEEKTVSEVSLVSCLITGSMSCQHRTPGQGSLKNKGKEFFFSLWYIYKKYYIKTQLRWKSVAELASVVVQQVKLLSPALASRVVLAQVLWPYFQSAFLLIHLGKEWRWSKSLGLWAHRRPRGKSSSWFWPTPTVVCNWENSTLCLPVSLYYCLSNK